MELVTVASSYVTCDWFARTNPAWLHWLSSSLCTALRNSSVWPIVWCTHWARVCTCACVPCKAVPMIFGCCSVKQGNSECTACTYTYPGLHCTWLKSQIPKHRIFTMLDPLNFDNRAIDLVQLGPVATHRAITIHPFQSCIARCHHPHQCCTSSICYICSYNVTLAEHKYILLGHYVTPIWFRTLCANIWWTINPVYHDKCRGN